MSLSFSEELGTNARDKRVRFCLWRLSGIGESFVSVTGSTLEVKQGNHKEKSQSKLHILFVGAGESADATSLARLVADLRVDRRSAMEKVIAERRAAATLKKDWKVRQAQKSDENK